MRTKKVIPYRTLYELAGADPEKLQLLERGTDRAQACDIAHLLGLPTDHRVVGWRDDPSSLNFVVEIDAP